MREKIPDDTFFWSFQDESNLNFVNMRYEDRQRIGDEAVAKRKALEEIDPSNPFYHRAAVSAEMAQMRFDMAYIVAENKKLKAMIGTIDWLHEQVGVLMGAYSHIKMLAEKCKIDYGLVDAGLKQIIKLKEELLNGDRGKKETS